MEKLTLNDFREALSRISLAENIYRLSDEELLSADLQDDLLLDSLDMLELTLELENSAHVSTPDVTSYRTVQAFLDACNNNA